MIISITRASENTIEIANGLSEPTGPGDHPEPIFKNHKLKPLPQNNNNLKMLLKMLLANFKL
jgi:hypothetical protein